MYPGFAPYVKGHIAMSPYHTTLVIDKKALERKGIIEIAPSDQDWDLITSSWELVAAMEDGELETLSMVIDERLDDESKAISVYAPRHTDADRSISLTLVMG